MVTRADETVQRAKDAKTLVRYVQCVGVSKMNREILISPSGQVEVSWKNDQRVEREHSGRVPPQTMDEMRELLRNWESLEPSYPGFPDAALFRIEYGGKAVTVGDGDSMPELFTRVRRLIERAADAAERN